MAQVTVRVTRETREAIGKLSMSEGRSMQAIVESAIREYGRTRLVEAINEAYGRLGEDPDEARCLEAERSAWDATSEDGLDAEPDALHSRRRGRRARTPASRRHPVGAR